VKRLLARALKLLLGLLLLTLLLLALGIRRDRPATEVEARRGIAPSKFVTAGGLRIHYRDRGSGPVILLLHGSNASLFTWEGWTAGLVADHRVIALDLPGHGLTGPDPQARYSARGMAEVVARFVAQLGLSRFSIAGNSMGGNVAWHYALAHPEQVDHLILIDSAGYPRQEPPPFAFRAYATPGVGRIARWVTPRFVIARSLRDAYADPARATEARIDEYQDLILRDGNREATRVRFSSAADDGLSARLPELKLPVLILWGARDRWIPLKYGQQFHRDLAGSRLVVFDGLGHVPMEEDPAATLAALRAWLK